MKNTAFAKTILICIFSFGLFSARAQYVSIPDSNFRHALINLGYGTCFDITQTMIDTTCSGILNADSLNIGVSDVSDLTGIGYFKHLRYLNCYHNPFMILPALPDSLTDLICYDGQITTLPPALPSTLRYLNFGDNSVSTLPPLPDSLRFLSFETNLVSVIPALPSSLTYLSCIDNQLTSLPSLPSSLTYLDCGANMIDSLPALPAALVDLFCGVNHLSSLPALPASLTRLYCNNNNLTTLPSLPGGLSRFYCFGNHLSALPALPGSLTWLDCSYNELTTLPALPDSLYSFDCRVNIGLYCLPQLNKILYFTYDSTGVGCLPDYPQDNVSSTPSLSNISVCGLSNPNGCPTYAGITDLDPDAINIYPNPASDIMTIKTNRIETSAAKYSITDLEGRVILSGNIMQGVNNINISTLTNGVYLVQTNRDSSPNKIIKN